MSIYKKQEWAKRNAESSEFRIRVSKSVDEETISKAKRSFTDTILNRMSE
jgi:hypothetical protein